MMVKTFASKSALGGAAAAHAAASIQEAVKRHGKARIIAATGASQFEFLDSLTATTTTTTTTAAASFNIPWHLVELFHLDEYVGLSINHPASFRRYLLERLINKVGIQRYHLLDAENDPTATMTRVGRVLNESPIDVAFVGIGENAHLAFNDPPADFETEEPYLIVELDEACRQQQVGEGWFASLKGVPRQAISMSIRQILKARSIICVVPDARKAAAVKRCLEGRVDRHAPASILQTHPDVTMYLDQPSASLLSAETITETRGRSNVNHE